MAEPDYAREIGLVMSGILLTVVFIFGFDLMRRYVKADKITRKSDSHTIFYILAWSLMGYSGYNIIAIIYYYYTGIGYARMYFHNEVISGLIRLTSLLLIIPVAHISEKILLPDKYKIKISSLTFGFSAIIGIFIVIMQIVWIYLGVNDLYPGPTSRTPLFFYPLVLAYIIFGLFAFFGLTHIIFFRLRPQKNESRLVLLGLASAIISFIGGIIQGIYRFNPDARKIYLIGLVIEIAGWSFVRHFLLDVPSYSEFEWRSWIYSLYVVMPEGLSLYHKIFKEIESNAENEKGEKSDNKSENNETMDNVPHEDLVACGFVGIKSLLEEITHQKSGMLEVLQIGNMAIIGGQADNVITFLIVEKNLGVYHSLMRELSSVISKANPQLKNFDGDLMKLNIKPIIEEYFHGA